MPPKRGFCWQVLAKNSLAFACESSWRSLTEGGKELALLNSVSSHYSEDGKF